MTEETNSSTIQSAHNETYHNYDCLSKDNTKRSLLLKILDHRVIPKHLIKVLQSLYNNTRVG